MEVVDERISEAHDSVMDMDPTTPAWVTPVTIASIVAALRPWILMMRSRRADSWMNLLQFTVGLAGHGLLGFGDLLVDTAQSAAA